MDRTDLVKLQRTQAAPAVSILMPTQRRRPGNGEDPLLLRDLLHDAEAQLVAVSGAHDAAPIAARLEAAVGEIDFDHPGDGIAVFATRDAAETFTLDFPVPPRVVVDETFATRDLVRGLARSPRYRVLVLSEKPTRLFDASGNDLVEVHSGGFPFVIEGARGEPLASGGYAAHTSRGNQELLAFFRAVDRAIDRTDGGPQRLIVVGPERDLAYFDAVTEHRALVIGRVAGNHTAAGGRELAAIVRPVVEEYMRTQQAGADARLVEAAGAGRLAVGIDEVWRCAHEGRGDMLAVQDGYEEPLRHEVDGKLEMLTTPDAPGGLVDVVDEVVETVLEHGGEVIFMDPEVFGQYAPIALTLRW